MTEIFIFALTPCSFSIQHWFFIFARENLTVVNEMFFMLQLFCCYQFRHQPSVLQLILILLLLNLSVFFSPSLPLSCWIEMIQRTSLCTWRWTLRATTLRRWYWWCPFTEATSSSKQTNPSTTLEILVRTGNTVTRSPVSKQINRINVKGLGAQVAFWPELSSISNQHF